MKVKNLVGKRARLVTLGIAGSEISDWSAMDGLKKDGIYKVVDSSYNRLGNSNWVRLEGKDFWHSTVKFEFEKNPIIVVLRRDLDRKRINKFLKERGWDVRYTDRSNDSRIIVIHQRPYSGDIRKETTFNGSCPFDRSVSESIESTRKHLKSVFGYTDDFYIVKTKPSVRKAVEQIESII